MFRLHLTILRVVATIYNYAVIISLVSQACNLGNKVFIFFIKTSKKCLLANRPSWVNFVVSQQKLWSPGPAGKCQFQPFHYHSLLSQPNLTWHGTMIETYGNDTPTHCFPPSLILLTPPGSSFSITLQKSSSCKSYIVIRHCPFSSPQTTIRLSVTWLMHSIWLYSVPIDWFTVVKKITLI